MSEQSVYIVSLGCPKNRVDSEVILTDLQSNAQYKLADAPEGADLIIVNTCGFIQSAKEESIETILEMAGVKEQSQGKTKLMVAGCLSQRYSESLAKEMPEVDYFVGTNQITEVSKILKKTEARRTYTDLPGGMVSTESRKYNSMSGHTAYLKISEGCSNKCAFCIIPKMRGLQVSRSIADITQEAKWLAETGVKEINLIAQDLTGYGYDLRPHQKLHDLLYSLNEIESVRWIRMLYAYPRNFPDALIEAMAACERVVPYLDMPLQHITDRLLHDMKRGTRRDSTCKILDKLREKIPDLVMRTTFIVGMPGETDADFQELCDFIEAYRFERMGVFTYSPEEDTPAATMDNQVEDHVKEERYQTLMSIQRDISEEILNDHVGQEVEVLVEGVSEETELLLKGRIATQAPDIDGLTYINAGNHKAGDMIRGRIVEVGAYDLVVEPIESSPL
jgi:ribosomal protein S12 methylthiotransferase